MTKVQVNSQGKAYLTQANKGLKPQEFMGIPRALNNGVFQTRATSWNFPTGVTTLDAYACYYGQYGNSALTSVSSFEDITAVSTYSMAYCFYNNTQLNQNWDFSKLTSVGNYSFSNCWYGCSSQNGHFDFSNLTSIGTNGLYNAFVNVGNNATFDFSKLTSIGSNGLDGAFSKTGTSNTMTPAVIFDNVTSVAAAGLSRAFRYKNPETVVFKKLASITAQTNCMGNIFENCPKTMENQVWHPFPLLNTFSSTTGLKQAFTYTRAKKIVFDSLENLGTTNTYSNCEQMFQNANFNGGTGDTEKCGVYFPALKIIGSEYTTSYKNFVNVLQSATSSVANLFFPELTTIYNYSSSSGNGQFNSCGATKIYMPKLTSMTTYPQYVFTSSSTLQEMHFGKENQATIEAIDGYSSKFGATNATIYFDLINHITVDGVVYDRYGKGCDYDNEYAAWKNGDTIIYTAEEWTPAVNDSTYRKSGNNYISTGNPITAVS